MEEQTDPKPDESKESRRRGRPALQRSVSERMSCRGRRMRQNSDLSAMMMIDDTDSTEGEEKVEKVEKRRGLDRTQSERGFFNTPKTVTPLPRTPPVQE
mmetsp:Transcript_9612/g.14148  ORF Transcript_9612/g.14148 Transcript_9612/m.14148 type:complete len:99 (-) Transcript_9612:239-535(-)